MTSGRAALMSSYANPQPGSDARTEALDENVACLYKPLQCGVAFGVFQVECKGLFSELVLPGMNTVISSLGAEKAPPVSSGRLHLDHFSSELRKKHRCMWTCDALAQVTHADP